MSTSLQRERNADLYFLDFHGAVSSQARGSTTLRIA